MAYHAHDGWMFDRVDEAGTVRISNGPVRVDLDNGTWCSIVAAVTAKGEDADTFNHAQSFHDGRIEFAAAPEVE